MIHALFTRTHAHTRKQKKKQSEEYISQGSLVPSLVQEPTRHHIWLKSLKLKLVQSKNEIKT